MRQDGNGAFCHPQDVHAAQGPGRAAQEISRGEFAPTGIEGEEERLGGTRLQLNALAAALG